MKVNLAAEPIYDSIVDGKGLRTTLFFQGCTHHCKGCQNPQTWDMNKIIKLYCVEDLIKEIEDNAINKNVTLSGGDPLCNYDSCLELCKQLKNKNFNIWLYTGFTYEYIINNFKDILKYVDVIVDGEFIESKKDLNLKYKGSSNQRVIDINKSKNSIVIFEEGD